ncbi:hypothetical protein MTO96_003049 [Rhipicephalus appendiculatus]
MCSPSIEKSTHELDVVPPRPLTDYIVARTVFTSSASLFSLVYDDVQTSRQYQSLKFGYGISDKKVQYKPFQMSVYIKDAANGDDVSVENASTAMCLVVTTVAIKTAYRVPAETPAMTCFSTRHTASCHYSHVDLSAAVYLGYLPQDMLGHSVFDFYCPEDMELLRDIYDLVMKEQGHSFRSKPYRFRALNGCFIKLETDWSCFINPWTRKLEFVVGQHRVIEGPRNPDVFAEASPEDFMGDQPMTGEAHNNNRLIQEQIKDILSQTVKLRENSNMRQRSNKRRKELASFVSTLVGEMTHKRVVDKGEEQVTVTAEGCTCSDLGSVVMGEISPHQELHDSDPSSESPPNIQEIRYQENIERFFASNPKTNSSDEPAEMKIENDRNSPENREEEAIKATASPQSSEDKSASDFAVVDSNYASAGGSGATADDYKDSHRLKRSGSPLVNSNLHKHNKSCRESTAADGSAAGAAASAAPFPPLLHAAASLVTSQPDNVAAFVPNLAIPTYTYVPLGGAHSPASTAPFLIPVMYVGGVPLYPSLPTGDGPQSKGMWQCGALPLMPLWQQPPVNGGSASGQEATKADAKTPGAPTGAATEKHSDDALRKPHQEGADKTSGPATITGLGDGSANGRRGSGAANGGTEIEGCSMRPFKPYASGFGNGPAAGGAKSDADDRRHSQSTEKDMHQDDSVSLSFESSFFEKSENSESQFSSEKSSEDTDSEMKDRRRKQPSRAVLREPHWTEGVSLTAELVYRYQMRAPDAADVLRGDRDKLQRMQQPRLVNEQLSVLQLELEDALDDEPAAEAEPMRRGVKSCSPSAGLGSSKSATLPDASAEAAEAQGYAMYAMEEDDLTQEMAAKEERLLSSYDPDFALADSDAEF